jgi:hypothetical protein
MARVLKKSGDAIQPPVVEVAQAMTIFGTRRRVLKEDSAVAQFSDPAVKARVRERLASNPELLPTAFSHRPGREGCELSAFEASRVLSGKSIKVSGFGFDVGGRGKTAMCLTCYSAKGCPSQLTNGEYTIALYESGLIEQTCRFCGSKFFGER